MKFLEVTSTAMFTYKDNDPRYTDEYHLEKAGWEGYSNYVSDILIKTVSNARHKLGRLLFILGGCATGLVSMKLDQNNPLNQDPFIQSIAGSILLYGSARAAAEITVGRIWFSEWQRHCEILKEAGIVRRFLLKTLRQVPSARPLVLETAEELHVDLER